MDLLGKKRLDLREHDSIEMSKNEEGVYSKRKRGPRAAGVS